MPVVPLMHTPYDGSARLFEIGLKPLDLADWIEADEGLDAYLAEKERLFAEDAAAVFRAEPDSDGAQAELLALLAAHLPARFPGRYRRQGDAIVAGARRIALAGAPPLWTAARLVQEDLVLLRRSEDGWRLAAGAVCFPSSWALADKIGKPMHAVHAPVPGFGDGSRPNELINRMFDAMRPQTPMLRWNWSLYGDDRLAHPDSAAPDARRFGAGERIETLFFRVERQTLRKLPASGAIVFTIRIFLDPLAALEQHADGPRLALALIEQLRALTPDQLAYKGMTLERDRVVARLADLAG
jgi:hypothetical protein